MQQFQLERNSRPSSAITWLTREEWEKPFMESLKKQRRNPINFAKVPVILGS
jgi:hypothetical protein